MEQFDAPATDENTTIPQLIGSNLRVEEELGRGGMGTVYRATHLGLDRVVAVKILNQEVAANANVSQRFAREAKLMAKLRHPRAAMIYDSGTLPDGRLFIVMEYVEGVTLADVLKKTGKMPYRQAVEIAVSICDVLSEAHSLGIIHRDLKPANIMLNGRDVYVLDFGIAKLLNSDSAETLKLSMTGNGALIGTPHYMSPEQCLGEPVEARSDLYSLGALLYETLSGRPPFDEEVFSAIIIKHAMVEPPPLNDLNGEIPAALIQVVNQLLAKKPSDRPANAEAAKVLLLASVASTTGNLTNNLHAEPNEIAAPVNNQTNNLTVSTGDQTNNSAAPSDVQTNSFSAPNSSYVTQSDAVVEPLQPSAANQNTNQFVSSQTLHDTTNNPPPAAGNRKYLYAGGALIALIAAFAAVGWMRMSPPSNAVIASSPAKSPSANTAAANYPMNMDSMNHGGMVMGDDFAETKTDDKTNAPSAPILSSEEADKVITRITQTTEHRADGMQIIKTPKDTALVCIHNMIEMGKTHMFAVERPNAGSQWEITARVSLDNEQFHGSNWTFEPQDVDNDGFEDVIFNGVNADQTARKVLIYIPRTRQNYWIIATKDANGKFTSRTLSPNAQSNNTTAIRKALEQTVLSN